jgi:imidazolonepropionase
VPQSLKIDTLFINANLATMVPVNEYGAVRDSALALASGKIAWVGPEANLPAEIREAAGEVRDLGGCWISPGLIDCHTHLVHGGSRAGEFELRLKGATYEEIARQGGGIVSTVKATREADEEELFETALGRLEPLLAEGLTTIEIKSGYGLDLETELTMLRVARRLGEEQPVTVKTTFLGAHALPPEYKDRADEYIDFICGEVLPRVAKEGLSDAVDGFVETIGFSRAQMRRVFDTAQGLGLPVKLHAEQLSDMGGAALAAGYKALSADHLEYLGEAGVRTMANSGTVAVLLPGAFYFLRETKLPPIQALRDTGVPIALATDCNPGTSPATSLLLMMNMGCTLFGLTPEEALAGVTRNAAKALGLGDTKGTLEVGKDADLALWEIDHPAELSYRMGFNPCIGSVQQGMDPNK